MSDVRRLTMIIVLLYNNKLQCNEKEEQNKQETYHPHPYHYFSQAFVLGYVVISWDF